MILIVLFIITRLRCWRSGCGGWSAWSSSRQHHTHWRAILSLHTLNMCLLGLYNCVKYIILKALPQQLYICSLFLHLYIFTNRLELLSLELETKVHEVSTITENSENALNSYQSLFAIRRIIDLYCVISWHMRHDITGMVVRKIFDEELYYSVSKLCIPAKFKLSKLRNSRKYLDTSSPWIP